jgi:hypothetical protein
MDTASKVIYGIVAVLAVFFLYWRIKQTPEQFSKENFSKTAGTLGVLGLLLIAFVGLCVLWLRKH